MIRLAVEVDILCVFILLAGLVWAVGYLQCRWVKFRAVKLKIKIRNYAQSDPI